MSNRSILCESTFCRFLDTFEAPENGIGLVEALSDHFRSKSFYLIATRIGDNDYLRLGTLTDITTRRECPFCRIVTSARDIDTMMDRTDDLYIMWDESHVAFEVRSISKPEWHTILPPGVRIALCGEPDHPESTIYWGRITNINNGFDPSQVKLWLSTCVDRHKSQCGLDSTKFEANMRSLEGQEFRLIDVQKECIVVQPWQSRYVALSYVWGQVEQLQLLKHSCASLTAPGSLAEHRDRIPKTVRDAMFVVSSVGEKYLWVDALCLMQDDPQSIVDRTGSMDFVYENALATIVAADGSDPSIGLQRLHPRLGSKSQRMETIKPGLQLMAIGALDIYLRSTEWFQRAWSFQEQVLSRRTIIFVNEQVYFRCRHCIWSEDTFADRFPDRRIDEDWEVNVVTRCASDLSSSGNLKDDAEPLSWLIMVLQITTMRKLTYATDAVNAVSSLLRVASRSIKSDLLQGLPIVALDYMLIFRVPAGPYWEPERNPKKRRREFPSWSWAGWKIAITWHSYANPRPDVSPSDPKEFNHWLDHGTWIVWFKSVGFDAPVAILTAESLKARSRAEGDVCYSRTSQPDLSNRFGKLDTSRTVPDALTSINPAYLHQQLLRFYTVSVNLRIAQTIPPHESWALNTRPSAALYDVEGGFSGLLKFDISDFLTEDGVHELILLSDSRDSVFKRMVLPDWNDSNPFMARQDPAEEWKLFWVLLLTWNDGVAERRGLGQILRSSVDKSFPPGPQWKEIVLG